MPGGDHQAAGRLRAEVAAGQVDGQRRLPVPERVGFRGARGDQRACVVYQDVHTAENVAGMGEQGLHVVRRGDVGAAGGDVVADATEFPRCLSQPVPIEVRDENPGAPPGKAGRHRLAESLGGARHDHPLAGAAEQPGHVALRICAHRVGLPRYRPGPAAASLTAAATTPAGFGRYMAAMAALASMLIAGTGGGVTVAGGAASRSQAVVVMRAQISAARPHEGWSKSATTSRPVLRTDSVTAGTSQGASVSRSTTSAEMPACSSSAAACRHSAVVAPMPSSVTSAPPRTTRAMPSSSA